MKKIWIEKLIELLNEYEKETKKSEYSQWRGLLWGRPQYLRCDTVESELLIISKGYHFIKWLVENDKINIDKVEKKFYNEICITDYWDKDRAYWKSDLVISVLSISDTPIEDLISYLK